MLLSPIKFSISYVGYYGISMVSVKIGSNAYISQILAALMGIPSYVFCIFLMDIWGRKPICCFGSILCGIVSIAAGFNDGTAQLILTLIGITYVWDDIFLTKTNIVRKSKAMND